MRRKILVGFSLGLSDYGARGVELPRRVGRAGRDGRGQGQGYQRGQAACVTTGGVQGKVSTYWGSPGGGWAPDPRAARTGCPGSSAPSESAEQRSRQVSSCHGFTTSPIYVYLQRLALWHRPTNNSTATFSRINYFLCNFRILDTVNILPDRP